MTLDKSNKDEPVLRKVDEQISSGTFVAASPTPGLVKHGKTPESTTVGSMHIPPPSSVPSPSKDPDPKSQQKTREGAFPSASELAEGLPLATESAVDRQGASFDVYARSYVPIGLRAINKEAPVNTIDTATKHKVAFGAYISTFSGRDFIGPHFPLDCEYPGDDSLPALELTEQTYAQYFTSLLRRECEAKERENKQHALYAVPLRAVSTPDGTRLWGLSVPGLREDSPLVEMGDILQIRQLWVDLVANRLRFQYCK